MLTKSLEEKIKSLNEQVARMDSPADIESYFRREILPYLPFYELKELVTTFNMAGLLPKQRSETAFTEYRIESAVSRFPFILTAGGKEVAQVDYLAKLLKGLVIRDHGEGRYYISSPVRYIL